MQNLNQWLFLLAIVICLAWVVTRRYSHKDLDRHTPSTPPTEDQIRWHIVNMRRDISMLAVTNLMILLVLVYAFVLKV